MSATQDESFGSLPWVLTLVSAIVILIAYVLAN
jgi:hypothetical protein